MSSRRQTRAVPAARNRSRVYPRRERSGGSMVIENYVLREGESHRTTYRTGTGDLKPCETEPISEEPAAAE